MKCPHCGASTRLFKSVGGVVKMRASILLFTDDGAKCAVPCPKCKEEIQVPVELRKSEVPNEPKLVLDPKRLTRSPGDP